MPKKLKQKKELRTRASLSQNDTVTGEASSSSAQGGAAFLVEPEHELDPDGDLVLILYPSSIGYRNTIGDARSKSMVKLHRRKVGQ